MSSPHPMSAFSLPDVAGDALLQEAPYPVIAPRSIEILTMIVQYARIEGLKVMVLGTGSSFADNFRLASANVIAAISGHRTLREVERYTRAADQARMAQAGMAMIAPAESGKRTSSGKP